MTRKLVVVNMSNWADESYKVWLPGGSPEGHTEVLAPGDYTVINTTDSEGLTIHPEKVLPCKCLRASALPLESRYRL